MQSLGFQFNIPTSYNRHQYQWTGYQYGMNVPFQPPQGVDPRVAQLFMQGSQIFRHYDKDWSGALTHHEFKKAIRHTGYAINDQQLDGLFSMLDANRTGRLDEREFCEFWVYSHGAAPPTVYQGMPGMGVALMGGQPGMMGGQPGMGQPGMMGGQPGMMQPGMVQPGMGGQPGMMGQQGMGQPGMIGGQQGFAVSATSPIAGFNFSIPTSYARPQLQWGSYAYNAGTPFQPPLGVDPRVLPLFIQGSQIFRHYDKNYTGGLTHHEFKHAMRHTGNSLNDQQLDQLFSMLDANRTGRVDEREFCEFWAHTHGAFGPAVGGMAPQGGMGGGIGQPGMGQPMYGQQQPGQPMYGQQQPGQPMYGQQQQQPGVGITVNVGVPGGGSVNVGMY